MQSNDLVQQVVHEVLTAQLGVGDDEVQPNATLSEDLGADSIDMVEIALELEERFDTEISDNEIGAVTTVADLCRIVRERVLVQPAF